MQTYSFLSKAAFNVQRTTDELRGKSAILLISVGQPYHEGDKLAATIAHLNRCDLAKCTIAVADTLQRHNDASVDPSEARNRAYDTGTQWLLRNGPIIGALNTYCDILRWDDACADSAYPDWYRAVEQVYTQESSYQAAVDQTVNTFVQRAIKRQADIDALEVAKRCLDYLLEECPIIMPLWASQGYDFIIYPQPLTAAMQATRERFVERQYPAKAQWLSLRFKHRTVPAHLIVAPHNAPGGS